MTMQFVDGFLAAMLPSMFTVAWLVWRADPHQNSTGRRSRQLAEIVADIMILDILRSFSAFPARPAKLLPASTAQV